MATAPARTQPPTGTSRARPAPMPRLRGHEVLALQLAARGCSADQIAAVRKGPVIEVLWDVQRALTVFGVPTVRDAVAAARRRGLID